MTIHFEEHKFSELNYKDYEKAKTPGRFPKDLRESLSIHTMASRCKVKPWKIKKLIDKFKLHRKQMVLNVLTQPDTHVPYHDEKAVQLFLKFAKKFKPDVYVNLGDWEDVESLARWNVGKIKPEMFGQRDDEITAIKKEVIRLEDVIGPKCRKIYTMGNHEMRAWAHYEKHPQSIRRMDILKWLKKKDWMVYPEGRIARVGDLTFTHSTYTSIAAAMKTCSYGLNMVFGHLHTLQAYSMPHGNQTVTCFCAGHLKDVEHAHVTYLKGKPIKWVKGFMSFQIDILNELFTPTFHFIKDNKMI